MIVNKILMLSVFITSSFCNLFAQEMSIEELFRPKMPTKTDTLYFPFYDGIQMIEVDHIGYWDRKIFFLEQSEPRALPHSMFHPQPLSNEFYFRDTRGTIVKAYNAILSKEDLTNHFKDIPINKKGSMIQTFLPYHISRNNFSEGAWVYSPQSMFAFNAHYKISNNYALLPKANSFSSTVDLNVLYGLIDTLGNIKVPIKYQEILPLKENLIVMQNSKWGIMDMNEKIIVPLKYTSYDNYYSEPENNKLIYFKDDKNYVAIYNIKKNSLSEIDNYERIYDHYYQFGYLLVFKNKHFGLIDLEGKVVLPVEYERVNNVNQADCTFKNCVSVVKDGKTYDIELK